LLDTILFYLVNPKDVKRTDQSMVNFRSIALAVNKLRKPLVIISIID
jgi:hypothetical protein